MALTAACAPAPPPATDQTTSENLAAFYRRVVSEFEATGRLRTERAPADAPIDPARLGDIFLELALIDEGSGRTIPLTRWVNQRVRVAIVHGASQSTAERAADRRNVSDLLARLSRATGLQMSLSDAARAEILVMVLTLPEQAALAARLRSDGGDPAVAPVLERFLRTSRSSPCSVTTYSSRDRPGEIVRAVSVIAGETEGLLRQSCYEEEIAQALGLINDSPRARPSSFNDDEEFALITRHDEVLLRVLYDPRLRPGMTEREIRPRLPEIIADALAAELGS